MFKLFQAALIGIGIGVLIAPDKGSATLRKVMSLLSDYKDTAKDYAGSVAGEIKSSAKSAKNQLDKM